MSGWSKTDLVELVNEMKRDLTRAKARLSTFQRMVSELPIPDEKPPAFVCPRCGIEKTNAEAMADHLANVHGEEPEAVREVA